MGVASIALLAGLLAVASVFDVREGRIPNWLTFGGVGLALLLTLAASMARWGTGDDRSSTWLTTLTFPEALWGLTVTGTLPLMLYIAASGGAGDVKLAWAMGALLGWRDGSVAVLLAYVVAGCAGLIWLVLTGRIQALIAVTLRGLGHWLLPGRVAPPAAADTDTVNRKMGMSPYFAAGTAFLLWERLPR